MEQNVCGSRWDGFEVSGEGWSWDQNHIPVQISYRPWADGGPHASPTTYILWYFHLPLGLWTYYQISFVYPKHINSSGKMGVVKKLHGGTLGPKIFSC